MAKNSTDTHGTAAPAVKEKPAVTGKTEKPAETKPEDTGETAASAVKEKSEDTGVSFANTKKYTVNSPKHAGGKVYGSSGIIEFDKDGNALVSAVDAEHLAGIPGYTVKEK